MTTSLSPDIALVRDFVNTVNLEDGPDEIADAAALQKWLTGKGLLGGARRSTQKDVERVCAVREALRDLIGATTGQELSRGAQALLDATAARAGLTLRFGTDGATRIVPSATGLDGALGRILTAAHLSMAHGTWDQLKLCDRHSCRWAFYDTSKNRSKRWCSMEVCGNREKGEAFRRRQHGLSTAPN